MKLQTQIPLYKVADQMDYQGKVVLLGSCFSENIGDKLSYFKFRALSNPFGILFHPKAIERLVARCVNKQFYTEGDIFFHNERWHCFDAHSDLSALTKEQLLENLNTGLSVTLAEIGAASHIFITLGTAWAYRHKETDRYVANCHKVPQKEFSKEMISVEANVESLRHIMELVGTINENVRFIFTVSPVRHLKDGFVENQRSKANLSTAIHEVLEKSLNVTYFPAYEIMMDELRDYRFYNADMVHPNTLAIDYIWEKFKYVWISEAVYTVMEKVDQIQKGMKHRPFNPSSEQHQQFLDKQQQKIMDLLLEYPFMKF
ncbi:hypothetical protein KCTC52924_01889 [Arenibacter antarcticus]|uniref:GSCFA domain-containing protein n=1 Tax=Arenibacter antarcticus TaxID=2040469 RepID=A0ABW5VJR7_9FLAO|nr:GSCFA domain-containing protein [Arenibacter sp. H213]MCM4167032.1 GSCFA domain-containing protein [Arenibacter sp. H213]